MRLHQNKDDFKTLVSLVADYYGIQDYQVEKDYFVSVLLKELSEGSNVQLVFKGGTSLSKCYKVIDWFSEDIDLALMTSDYEVSQRNRRSMKEFILSKIENSKMEVMNHNEIRSRRDFNSYKVRFENVFDYEDDVFSHIVVETIVAYRPYPTTSIFVNNFVTNYLIEMDRSDIINSYDLQPFKMLIQSIDRTFIDKLFAICDYHIQGKYERYSRPLYDLYMIWKSSLLNIDRVNEIMLDVIYDRQRFEDRNPSCKKGSHPNLILKEIIETEVYKDDYLNVTDKLIYKSVPYEHCTETIFEIINLGIIPDLIVWMHANLICD